MQWPVSSPSQRAEEREIESMEVSKLCSCRQRMSKFSPCCLDKAQSS